MIFFSMVQKFIDLTGRKFGRLLVTRMHERRASNGSVRWFCKCDCGTERVYEIGNAKRDGSCGCIASERLAKTFSSRLENYIPEPNTGCWLWLGALSKEGGYGQISVGGKMHKAHRRMFEFVTNKEIPLGMEVCHHCDNPCCVNPDHLFLGTHLENMKDRDRKKRRTAPRGMENGSSILSEEQVQRIRRDLSSRTKTQMQIAAEHGCDQTTISLIKLGKRWSHVS